MFYFFYLLFISVINFSPSYKKIVLMIVFNFNVCKRSAVESEFIYVPAHMCVLTKREREREVIFLLVFCVEVLRPH